MALIDEVKKVCARLGPKGWRALLLPHGLDIAKVQLRDELAKSLTGIDRTRPGFQDFALDGTRGIEPGKPARSLLYHALASPNVADPSLTTYPTLAEIEAVENYVFGVQPPSIQELKALAGTNYLSVAVFAVEYRPAHETVHELHADLCFSRTGVARVGTKRPAYDARARGFLPHVRGDKPHDIRVLPARYSAYVAAEKKGSDPTYGPMSPQAGDGQREFWVPLHKLFDGQECIRDHNLNVELVAKHRNDKLARIHVATKGAWAQPGWDLTQPPFILEKNLAEFSKVADHGTGLLVPEPNPLVEEARYKNKPLTFKVLASAQTYSSSLNIPETDEGRKAPEYVHARHAVRPNGTIRNLNKENDVVAAVEKGGYLAKHYVDYTADGWIEGLCPEIAVDISRRVPAYSLVTPPDFFVNTDQRELHEWTQQSVRSSLRASLWVSPPDTLNNVRLAPNLALTDRFVKEDSTVTAIVCLPRQGPASQAARPQPPDSMRHAHLPDAAAGLFQPGWDVSHDTTKGTEHLAMHGLGSPFPEDMKLCAALSTYWPAVAPDSARVFEPNVFNDASPTIAPLTDREIGIGGTAWDGVTPPKVKRIDGTDVVEYEDAAFVDYVDMAKANKFSLATTGKVDTHEYQARVLAMARVYRALGITSGDRNTLIRKKSQWSVLSFKKLPARTPELTQAEKATKVTCSLPVYRFELYRPGTFYAVDNAPSKTQVEIRKRALLFVDGLNVLSKVGGEPWHGLRDA